LSKNAEALRAARNAGCNHRIMVAYARGVPVEVYDEGLRRLYDIFAIKMIGPKP